MGQILDSQFVNIVNKKEYDELQTLRRNSLNTLYEWGNPAWLNIDNILSDELLSPNVTVLGNVFNGNSQLVQLTAAGKYPALDGSLITNLTSTETTDASLLTSGTLSNDRLTTDVTLLGNVFNGNSQLVQLTGAGKYPALDGSLITNIPATTNASLLTNGLLNDARLNTTVTVQGNTFNAASKLVQLTAANKYPALDGSLITNLPDNSTTDASLLTSGLLPDARLSSNVTLAGNLVNGPLQLVLLTAAGKYPSLDGSLITNIPATTNASLLTSGTLSDLRLNTTVTLAGNTFNTGNNLVQLSAGKYPALDGSLITNLPSTTDASLLTSGTLVDGRLSANVTLAGNTFNGASNLVQLTVATKYPALDGSLITNIPATTNASLLTSGTLADARLNTTVTVLGNVFNGNSQLVQLTAAGKYPALDGSLITNVSGSTTTNASLLTSGTLADARLTANVTLVGNTFNGNSQLVQLTAAGKYPALDGSLITNLPSGGGSSLTPVVDAQFAWVNQGTATISSGCLSVAGNTSLDIKARVKTAPTAPYTLTVGFQFLTPQGNCLCGIVLRESSSSKLILFAVSTSAQQYGLEAWGEGAPSLLGALPITTFLKKFTNETTFSADYTLLAQMQCNNNIIYLRIVDDNTNRKCYVGDGVNFILVHTVARTDFITPNQIGFAVSDQTTIGASLSMLHWLET